MNNCKQYLSIRILIRIQLEYLLKICSCIIVCVCPSDFDTETVATVSEFSKEQCYDELCNEGKIIYGTYHFSFLTDLKLEPIIALG